MWGKGASEGDITGGQNKTETKNKQQQKQNKTGHSRAWLHTGLKGEIQSALRTSAL